MTAGDGLFFEDGDSFLFIKQHLKVADIFFAKTNIILITIGRLYL
jgi:hypothetical protein